MAGSHPHPRGSRGQSAVLTKVNTISSLVDGATNVFTCHSFIHINNGSVDGPG